jgi:hypothetical protein
MLAEKSKLFIADIISCFGKPSNRDSTPKMRVSFIHLAF